MAEKTPPDNETEEKSPVEDKKSLRSKISAVADRLVTRKWLVIVLSVSIVAHTIGLTCYKIQTARQAKYVGNEVTLGDFGFTADRVEPGQVKTAEFSVHVALLDEVSRTARARLEGRACRVQQDVEELLRLAKSHDFDDPVLGELKLQLQEQINKTLEIRAVSEVIITDLTTDRAGDAPPRLTETAESVRWIDAPSS